MRTFLDVYDFYIQLIFVVLLFFAAKETTELFQWKRKIFPFVLIIIASLACTTIAPEESALKWFVMSLIPISAGVYIAYRNKDNM